MSIFDQDLTEDQIMMRDVCRRFVDNTIIPFIQSCEMKIRYTLNV